MPHNYYNLYDKLGNKIATSAKTRKILEILTPYGMTRNKFSVATKQIKIGEVRDLGGFLVESVRSPIIPKENLEIPKYMYDQWDEICNDINTTIDRRRRGKLKMGTEELYELYKTDVDFKAYVDRYCKTYNVNIFEAFTHKTVAEVADFHKEQKHD